MSVTNKRVRMRERAEKECVAVNEAVELFRDKWTLLVLGALSHAPSLRYNELQREVGGISQRMLTLTLKTLEENGLVKRTLLPAVPPRVDYELTALGSSLGGPMRALLEWSTRSHPAMAEARRAYATKRRSLS